MKNVREETIRCVCGWTGRGYGGDPCSRCGSVERRLLDPHEIATLRAEIEQLTRERDLIPEQIAVWLESMVESDDDGTEFTVIRIGCADAAEMIRAGTWKKKA